MSYKNNIFTKILTGEVPCRKIFENEIAFSFYDINPKAKVHALVIPKINIISFEEFAKEETKLIGEFFKTVNHIACNILNLNENFKLIINNGERAGQEVFHFHVHILSN